MSYQNTFAIMVAATLAVGCRTSTEPLAAGTGALTTDASAYVARPNGQANGTTIYGLTVVTTFRNPAAAAVNFDRCNPLASGTIYSVVLVSPPGASGYNPRWACVGGVSPIVVPSGGTWVDTVHLAGPTSFDGITHEPDGRVDGVFRLVYFPVCESGCTLPDSLGWSNAFHATLGS